MVYIFHLCVLEQKQSLSFLFVPFSFPKFQFSLVVWYVVGFPFLWVSYIRCRVIHDSFSSAICHVSCMASSIKCSHLVSLSIALTWVLYIMSFTLTKHNMRSSAFWPTLILFEQICRIVIEWLFYIRLDARPLKNIFLSKQSQQNMDLLSGELLASIRINR